MIKFLRKIFKSKRKKEIETLKSRTLSLESSVTALKCGGGDILRNSAFPNTPSYWEPSISSIDKLTPHVTHVKGIECVKANINNLI